MMSIRAISRSIPRAAFRSSPVSAFRPFSSVARPSLLQSLWKPTQRPTYALFSTSSARREQAGTSDVELSAKFDQELRLEKESRDTVEVPANVQAYLSDGPFEVQDTPGSEEVFLTRKFGNETIKVAFSIADMNNMEEDQPEMDEDVAMADEEGDLLEGSSRPKRTINQSGVKGGNVDVVAEDSIAPSDRAAQGEEEDGEAGEGEISAPYPTTLNVTITKAGKGAVQITAIAQDGYIEIEDVFYFPKADVADPQTADKMHERQHVYAGPPFGNLDTDLQSMLYKYLEERGVDGQLAMFVPDYIDYKEQREYVQWLENMKTFIDT